MNKFISTIRILPAKILAILTGTGRYFPEIEWSDKSYVHNIFRFYEMVFGRREGIRREMISELIEGREYHRAYTFEASCALIETYIRTMLAKRIFIPIEIFVPALKMSNGMQLPGPYMFAIATDAISNNNTSGTQISFTLAHTITGSNRVLMGGARTLPVNAITTLAYATVNMTQVNSTPGGSNDRTIYLYYLIAPTTGTNNTVATYNASTNGSLAMASYTGVLQTGFPDSSAVATKTVATSRNVATTVVASNCWLVMMIENDSNTLVAGTGTTIRSVNAGTTNLGILDSNGTVGTGSQQLQASFSGSNANNEAIIVSMAPALATINGNFLAFM